MKRTLPYAFIILCTCLQGQNLVPNFDFDDVTECPNDRDQLNLATSWYKANFGTPDLFHSCGEGGYNTPSNARGFAVPSVGEGYVGLRLFSDSVSYGREYIGVQLATPLEAGKNYHISFDVRPAMGPQTKYFIDAVGMYISALPPDKQNVILENPQLENPTGNILTNTNEWYTLSSCIEAKGGEEYITIGNFRARDEVISSITGTSAPWGPDAYYYVDNVVVEKKESEEILNISGDTLFCEGTPVFLNNILAESSSTWQDGSEDNEYEVTTGGKYVLTATLGQCKYKDSTMIQFLSPPSIELGEDTAICKGDTLVIGVEHQDKVSYVWSTGDTTSMIQIYQEGEHTLLAYNQVCAVEDSRNIYILTKPELSFEDTVTLCGQQKYMLDIRSDSATYLWNDGENSPVRTLTQTGLFAVTITNKCGVAEDTLFIRKQEEEVYVPNVITPNGDGINDQFEFQGASYCVWNLKIYNKWGNLIADYEDYTSQWPESNKVPDGVYFIELNSEDAQLKLKGWLKVIR